MRNPLSTLYDPERIESFKAAAIAGITVTAVALAIAIAHAALQIPALTGASVLDRALHLAVALVSGALFGITYRYVVRRDHNPQLAAGATGAFGLLRGLAQVEIMPHTPLWLLALALGESMALFAIAQWLLQYFMERGWLQPFGD